MDDAAAIKRCQEGDREAFRLLVERYQRQAVSHAVAVLRNHEDALDATQEAFIDAFGSIARFDNTRPFYPWFYVLLRNRCYKMASHRRPAEEIDEAVMIAPQSAVTPEERLTLERSLWALTDEQREVVTLKYFDGLSYDEIAEQLEIPKGTVMSRLFYARKELRRQMEGEI